MNSLGFDSIKRTWLALPQGWGGRFTLRTITGIKLIKTCRPDGTCNRIFVSLSRAAALDKFGVLPAQEFFVERLESNKWASNVNTALGAINCYGQKTICYNAGRGDATAAPFDYRILV